MNGWEITCVVVGIILVLESLNLYGSIIGALLILIPLYFNFWKG